MEYNFKNYCFEGGGIKGLAYVGALNALEEKGIHKNIKRVSGASAGAICSLLVALNYSTNEIQDILWSMNFMDKDWGVIRNCERLIEDYGWYKGDFFEKWIKEKIKNKTGSETTTFKELAENSDFKEVVFIGTNLSTHHSEIFSVRNTPDMCLYEALRITMSIPLFFKAIKKPLENDKDSDVQIYVDGGLLMNYPVKVFDRESYMEPDNIQKKHYKKYYRSLNKVIKKRKDKIDQYVYNKETLGFRLDSKNQIDVFKENASPTIHHIENTFDYMWHLVKTIYSSQENIHLHSDDWHRTVYIDTIGVQTTDFDISDEMKEKLVQQGYDNTMAYFEWFDDPKRRVMNR